MIKTLSYATVHFTIAFSVTWILTGDVLVGGMVALIEPSINTLAYFFHEKVWLRIDARRKPAGNPQHSTLTLG